ncbi:energy-coupling factor ABC transporter ATP-binding protein [uncultured Brevibacillus sp.]|uniref:energy-coupling factor ABC transporter ATP-binding protein n=1 Tax=uncultured Brevibacillus sp. TaxID=169970 RepID=UPI002595E288|nr:ABC transporter ATP-binding protein [uncultured Brevibacillus sp.]
MSTVIAFEDVWYGYETETPVLKGVSLTIGRGEFIAIIGGNGSGKTTLAKHCNGLYKPIKGVVTVNGEDTRDRSVAQLSKTVAYCYQNPDHQIFHQTVKAEVSFGPKNRGLPAAEIEQVVNEALAAVGLAHMGDAEPYFTSKGTRQKIAVASILAMRPDVIVLDEPTTGLDYRGMQEMLELVRRLHESGHTIIVITHDMRLVAEYAQRVIVMQQGKVVCDGSPAQVFAEPQILASAQVVPPAIYRFGKASGLADPIPLTYAAMKKMLTGVGD